MIMKIYTVTFLEHNYGSVMQAFALQQKLKEFGAEPIVLLRDVNISPIKKIRKWFRFIKPRKHYSLLMRFKTENLQWLKYKKKNDKIDNYISHNIKVLRVKEIREFTASLKQNDILLAGSDQIWSMINGNLSDWYTFNWGGVPDGVKRLSYAASIGLSELSEEQKIVYRKKLKNFLCISFREEQAQESLVDCFPCKIRTDLDPTLLYDEKFWSNISSDRIENDSYIFVYMLRPDVHLIYMARRFAKKRNLKVIYTGLLPDRYYGVTTVYDAGVAEFLSYIKYADYVITNSFHGTVFSILFKRQFVNVIIASTSSRAKNLLKILHLTERMISNENEVAILDDQINYDEVDKLINEKRKDSIDYIKYICRLNDENTSL